MRAQESTTYTDFDELDGLSRVSHAPGMLEHLAVADPAWHADLLFFWLDNRRLSGLEGTWRTEVVGIQMADGEAWVQVAQSGKALVSVVLHLSRQTTAEKALESLEAWAWQPSDQRPPIIRA